MNNFWSAVIVLLLCAAAAAAFYEPVGAQLTQAEMRAEPPRDRSRDKPKCSREELGAVGKARVWLLGFPKDCYR